jgi:hypothetical protein
VTVCPTTYLIGITGKAIDVIAGKVSEEDFLAKLNKAIDVKQTLTFKIARNLLILIY